MAKKMGRHQGKRGNSFGAEQETVQTSGIGLSHESMMLPPKSICSFSPLPTRITHEPFNH